MRTPTTRTISAQIIYDVVYKKINLSNSFSNRLQSKHSSEFKSAVKALCFETIRFYLKYENWWTLCLNKKPKDKLLRVVLTQAIAEFKGMQKPEHAVVNEAINTAKKLKKGWAKGLINSCLRKAVLLTNPKQSDETVIYSHPQWWIKAIKHDWPNHWQRILEANNKKPPLWIRARLSPPIDLECHAHKHIKNAHSIEAQDVTKINAFTEGDISVQDASAQLAALIVNPQDGEKILDACAAPGGKTCHILELNKNIQLDAIELFPNRAKKITENLNRLKQKAKVIVADTKNTDSWFNGKAYDKILLDAPCSASGIIRRHPDIKFIRQPNDFSDICKDQQELLRATSEVLKPNGTILYATCSIFHQENSLQIKKFLKTHPDFSEIKLKYPFAVDCEYGIQIISGTEDADGFYYCYLRKNEV